MDRKDIPDSSNKFFDMDYKCSQSVFTAFAVNEGLDKDFSMKISKFLGSGFLYRGEMCGAVSAALMAYSMKYAAGTEQNEVSDEIFYKLCSEHINNFQKKFGTVSCKELIGFHMGIPEELEQAKKSGVFEERCPAFVNYSAEILAKSIEFIEEKKKKYPELFKI